MLCMESVKGMNSYSNKKKKVKRLDGESEGVGGGSKFGFKRQENRVTIHLASRTRHEMKEIKRRLVSELEVVRRLVKKIEDVGSGEKRMPKVNNKFYKERMVSGKGGKSGGKKQVGVDAKVVNKLFKSCGVLLERLMKHKHGWVFNAPVDPLALGLHDYFDVIKNPMDLGTVKSRLDKNWYNSPMEFAEDVRLTFHNAMTYNPQGHDVYIMAEVLLKLFEEKWKVIEAEYIRESRVVENNEVGLPLPTPLPKRAPPPVPEMRSEPHVPAVQPIEQPPKVSKLGRTPSLKKPKARDINKREMTYDEKQKLSIDLQNLPSEKLDNVVHIIKKRLPSLSQKDDEIEVDIDTFDIETLWELDRFVANYKKGLTKNKRKAEFSNDDRMEAESEFPNDERIEVQSELPNHERIEVESEFPNQERTEAGSEFLNQERTEVESEFPNQERTEVESEFPNYERMEDESEFPNQERIEVEANLPHKDLAQVMVDVPKEAETDGRMTSVTSPVQMQKQVEEQVAHGDKSSSSSSSSSNSGSSSSGSDSDSSSGAGSDAGHSSKA